jgi:hypothetical protein
MSDFPRPMIRSPFRQSTTSMAGMVLCVFCCTLVLLNACGDETGHRLSAVTAAFQSNVASHGLGSASVSKVRSSVIPAAGLPEQTELPSTRNVRSSADSRIQRTEMDDEQLVLEDPDRDAFASFLRELSRLATVTPARSFDGEVTVDFLSTGPRSQTEIVAASLNLIHSLQREAQIPAAEVELVLWAGTPENSSLAKTALEAVALKQEITSQLSSSERTAYHLCTSGRIWYSETELRPAMTIVIRRAVFFDE